MYKLLFLFFVIRFASVVLFFQFFIYLFCVCLESAENCRMHFVLYLCVGFFYWFCDLRRNCQSSSLPLVGWSEAPTTNHIKFSFTGEFCWKCDTMEGVLSVCAISHLIMPWCRQRWSIRRARFEFILFFFHLLRVLNFFLPAFDCTVIPWWI